VSITSLHVGTSEVRRVLIELQIEWIKGLLAVPFVLHSQPTAVYNNDGDANRMSDTARERYSQIMQDVETLVLDHSEIQGLATEISLG